MSAEFLPREAFADEQSYIAHRQHVAALQRAERRHAHETAWQRTQREDYRRRKREGRLTPAERKFERMKVNEYERGRRRAKGEDHRRHAREYMREWRNNNLERHRQKARAWYWSHREEQLLRRAIYHREHHEQELFRSRAYEASHREQRRAKAKIWRQTHREQVRAYKRAYHRAHRDQEAARRRKTPDGQSSRKAVVSQFERQVVELRQEGWEWPDVAELTGQPIDDCRSAYRRWQRREYFQSYRDRHKWESLAHRSDSRDTITFERQVFDLREQGLPFVRIGVMLGKSDVACGLAYRRFIKRQAEQQDTQQSA